MGLIGENASVVEDGKTVDITIMVKNESRQCTFIVFCSLVNEVLLIRILGCLFVNELCVMEERKYILSYYIEFK